MPKSELISHGAEAIISLDKNNQIQKNRVPKSYRLKELDDKLRKRRTRSESKIINKLSKIINVPKIIDINEDDKIITMSFIDGKKLSEHLENLDWKIICKQLSETISKLHDQDIVHGDLTTSNMIYKNKNLYLIDFGLGFHSRKVEDKAVDLHLLKQALEAKHFKIADQAINIILKNYKGNQHDLILERIKTIEKRGRYRH